NARSRACGSNLSTSLGLARAMLEESSPRRRGPDIQELPCELRHKDRMIPIRTGGNHADPGAGFFLDEFQVVLRPLRQPGELTHTLSGCLPSWQGLIHALQLFEGAGIGRDF